MTSSFDHIRAELFYLQSAHSLYISSSKTPHIVGKFWFSLLHSFFQRRHRRSSIKQNLRQSYENLLEVGSSTLSQCFWQLCVSLSLKIDRGPFNFDVSSRTHSYFCQSTRMHGLAISCSRLAWDRNLGVGQKMWTNAESWRTRKEVERFKSNNAMTRLFVLLEQSSRVCWDQ